MLATNRFVGGFFGVSCSVSALLSQLASRNFLIQSYLNALSIRSVYGGLLQVQTSQHTHLVQVGERQIPTEAQQVQLHHQLFVLPQSVGV